MLKKTLDMDTNLVTFKLRRTGAGLMLAAEAAREGPQTFTMAGIQMQRFRFEHDVLQALQKAGIRLLVGIPSGPHPGDGHP